LALSRDDIPYKEESSFKFKPLKGEIDKESAVDGAVEEDTPKVEEFSISPNAPVGFDPKEDPKLSRIVVGLSEGDLEKFAAVPAYAGVKYRMKWRYRGGRHYELSNHLGNVQVVVTDKKIAHSSWGVDWAYYTADVYTASDYGAFGMEIEERGFVRESKYRYSFNGKETDDETGVQDYGMRLSDARLGRFWSVDPLTRKYSMLTPYQFASNSPISGIDLDGLEYYYAADGKYLGQGSDSKSTEVRLARSGDKTSSGFETFIGIDKNGKDASTWTVLHKSHETFQRFAAMVYDETSQKGKLGHEAVDPIEPKAIASATMNLVAKSKEVGLNYELEDILAVAGTCSGIGNANFKEYLDEGYKQNWKGANGAVVNALLGGTDYSNGAIQWDGEDFAKQGKSFSHYVNDGLNLKDPDGGSSHYDNFIAECKKKDSKIKPITGTGLCRSNATYSVTASYGRTIFWGGAGTSAPHSLKDGISNPSNTAAKKKRIAAEKAKK
jgi:RHS repeat-associated protein